MNTLLIALGIFLAGFGAAWSWQGSRGDAQIADLKLDHSQAALDAAIAAARKVAAQRQRADDITRAASRREADLDQKLQETHHALKTATRGRPCLGGSALRLLDQSTGLHAPPGAPDGRPAAPAADPADEGNETASDTDVAGWIATAGRYYERCRGRIRDIRAYEGVR